MTSYSTLICLNLVPFIFVTALYRHRDSLEDEATREKIGSLYQTVQPTSVKSQSYSIVFLLRRSLFVLITFQLFDFPTVQIQLQMATILLYIAYTQFAILYDDNTTRKTEFCNEIVFLLSSYHMMVFASPWLLQSRIKAGWSLIVLIVAMILFNYVVIISLSLGECKRKMKRWKMKKFHDQ